MKVRAAVIPASDIPANIEPFTRQRFITAGTEYDVHAVAVIATGTGVPFVQVVDDLGYPAWLPHILFNIVDMSLPLDWRCNCVKTGDGGNALLLGPDFVVRDEQSYNDMVELDADQVDRFWRRIDSLSPREELE
jgi:hypothetical protein